MSLKDKIEEKIEKKVEEKIDDIFDHDSNEVYQYNYNYLPPLAMLDKMPNLGFTLGWAFLAGVQVVKVLINILAIVVSKPFDEFKEGLRKIEEDVDQDDYFKAFAQILGLLKDLAGVYKEAKSVYQDFEDLVDSLKEGHIVKGLKSFKALASDLSTIVEEGLPSGKAENIQDYRDLFKTLPLPEVANTFETDEFFADMRVAGPNPLVIERMTEALPKFPVTNAQYQAVMGADDNLEDALTAGRVYIADYGIFDGAVQGSYPVAQKYIDAPMAMYAVPAQGRERRLKAIAIQCGQDPARYPIFTPNPKGKEAQEKWQMAKIVVQVADGNYHEAISHLGQTHLVVEPFVLATHNELGEEHPVGKLLTPHYEGTLFINNAAQSSLMAPGGGVDDLLAATIDQSEVFAAKGTQARLFNFNQSFLKETLKARGVDDPNLLPYYPYRDDALLIWDAIESWVGDYLAVYYTSDEQVLHDEKLQKWLAQLLSHEGGRLKNMGEDGKIRTIAYLSQALTMVIFTASA